MTVEILITLSITNTNCNQQLVTHIYKNLSQHFFFFSLLGIHISVVGSIIIHEAHKDNKYYLHILFI